MAKDIIGVIAGTGSLPQLIQKYCKENGIPCYFVFVNNIANFPLEKDSFCNIKIGQVGKALKFFNKHKVNKVILAGGIQKPNFSEVKVDFKGAMLLSKILRNKMLGDNTLLTTIIKYLEKHKFRIIAVDELLPFIHLAEGSNNKIKIHKTIKHDVMVGVNIIKDLSKYDIGQSLIVQNGRIVAIEAAEGTDNMIIRSKEFIEKNAKHPAILVKLKKPTQDRRVDLPTIGIKTIQNLINSNIKGIVLDTANTIVLEKEKLCKLAEENGIFIYAIDPENAQQSN